MPLTGVDVIQLRLRSVYYACSLIRAIFAYHFVFLIHEIYEKGLFFISKWKQNFKIYCYKSKVTSFDNFNFKNLTYVNVRIVNLINWYMSEIT